MNQDELRKLQIMQLELMDEVHRICVKHNIHYYMIGGTALGAVRHKGFIPWDLDIDIAMRRADYDYFKEVCKNDLNPRFRYRDYTNSHNHRPPHALICINNTVLTLRSDKYNPNKENVGIYLDIFPLDNAPMDRNAQEEQAKQIIKLKKIKAYKMAECYDKGVLKTKIKRLRGKAIFWTSVDKINAKIDRTMRRYNDAETGYLCSMASHYSYKKQYMPQDVYGIPQLISFEDRQYYAPEKLEDYLTRIFKDYMKLPPKEEQEAILAIFEKVVFDK